MAPSVLTVTWIVAASLTLVLGRGPDVIKMSQVTRLGADKIPEPGTIVNCGKPSTQLSIKWTPTKLRFGDTVHISVHINPPANIFGGIVNVTAYEVGETASFYESETSFTCADIHPYVPGMCPFYKDKPISVSDYKVYLKPSLPIPTDNYIVKAFVMDSNRNELLCALGHIILLDD